MSLMKLRSSCYLHTHFVNPHNDSATTCLTVACAHFSNSMISVNILSIILILNLFKKKLLKQWKILHKLPMDFWKRFCVIQFEASKNQMKFQYLWDRFEYFLNKSINPKMNLKFKPHLAYFDDGVVQSQTDTVTVTSDYPLSPHQTASPP